MPYTLVIQSHQSPLPYAWLAHCLDSVRRWCALHRYDYRFVDDALFDVVPAVLLEKTRRQRVIATDLARLLLLRQALDEGYDTVVWLDADFLIFNPQGFVLPVAPYAVGREVWVQQDKQGRLKVYKKVHNAFLLFRQGNSFLDFYADTAERMLAMNEGAMSPQFIGPKLLTALHNVAMLPVLESAGMLSPPVIRDMVQGSGKALSLFAKHSPQAIAGANLCTSSREKEELACDEMEQVITALLEKPLSFAFEQE